MASAPTVQALNDLVAKYTAAQAPQQQQIDTEISANDQSGQAQQQGLEAAKDTSFKNIDQNSSNRGMYFSGFRPNEQATYLGSTYLPALAKLQQTIAGTRTTLLGKKADLAAGANTSALGEQSAEQRALDSWNANQAQIEAQAAAAARNETFTASENAKNRASQAAISAASNAAAHPTTTPGDDIINGFKGFIGQGGALGAANTKNNRQAQDAYIQRWFINNGVLDPGAQTQVWNLINSTFHRPNDPTKDWTYKR